MKKIIIVIFSFVILSKSVLANVCNQGFADIIDPLLPSVVNIYTTQNIQHRNVRSFHFEFPFKEFKEFFKEFEIPFDGEQFSSKSTALGSGFIIDADGYVVTNEHVVLHADEIKVKLNDGQELNAILVGSDSRTDLALLKIDSKKKLPFVKFGNSDKARVGDYVLAIGNPFGLNHTVTHGIVSAMGRNVDDVPLGNNDTINNYIQTDASINRGNSGGPMFNVHGEVIGVNTAILSPSGTHVGVGFAIPSNSVEYVVSRIKKHGKISRGFLSVVGQNITTEIAEGLGLKDEKGVLIVKVDSGGDGDKAGLQPGDIILSFNGKDIDNMRKLQTEVAETLAGSEIKIGILRNKEKKELTCKITEQNSNVSHDTLEINELTFGNLTDNLKKKYRIDDNDQGILVLNIKNTSKWDKLSVGDLVLSINQQKIKDIKSFDQLYNDAKKQNKKNIVLLVKKFNSDAKIYIALPIL